MSAGLPCQRNVIMLMIANSARKSPNTDTNCAAHSLRKSGRAKTAFMPDGDWAAVAMRGERVYLEPQLHAAHFMLRLASGRPGKHSRKRVRRCRRFGHVRAFMQRPQQRVVGIGEGQHPLETGLDAIGVLRPSNLPIK